MFTVETIDPSDREYQLIHGHCQNYPGGRLRCSLYATVMLVDETGKPVPGGKHCEQCARETIDEYAEKLDIQWTAEPLKLYRVHGQREGTEQVIWGTFYNREYAQKYADKLNEVKG